MVRKKILLLLVSVSAIALSCIVVALVTKYFVDKGEPEIVLSRSNIVKRASEPSPVAYTNTPVAVQPVLTVKNAGADVVSAREAAIPAETEESGVAVEEPAKPGAGEPVMPASPTDTAAVAGFQSSSIVILPVMPPGSSERTDSKLPAFTPVNNSTGPTPAASSAGSSNNAAQNPHKSADISGFVPQPSTTGPVPEKTAFTTQPLPQFTPVQSQTGPVKTDNK